MSLPVTDFRDEAAQIVVHTAHGDRWSPASPERRLPRLPPVPDGRASGLSGAWVRERIPDPAEWRAGRIRVAADLLPRKDETGESRLVF